MISKDLLSKMESFCESNATTEMNDEVICGCGSRCGGCGGGCSGSSSGCRS